MEGKGMVVCMSRRICVELYNAMWALRPGWHSEDDAAGQMKIVMTGSASDPLEWQQHIRNKARRDALAKRFKDPADAFRLVHRARYVVDRIRCAALHTMYVDKPMRGHGLMQAIARVNRVFKDKPGGLVVDYLGLADQLRGALATYTQSGGTGRTAIDQAEAVAAMKTKYEVCCGLFHGFNWSLWMTGTPTERLSLLPAAQEHILAQEDGKRDSWRQSPTSHGRLPWRCPMLMRSQSEMTWRSFKPCEPPLRSPRRTLSGMRTWTTPSDRLCRRQSHRARS